MLEFSGKPQMYAYINLNQNQVYPPNLLVVLDPFVVNRSLDAMADIPTQSSNPNMYSLPQFYPIFSAVL